MKTKVMGTICVLISIFLTSACATGKIDAPQALAEEPTVGGKFGLGPYGNIIDGYEVVSGNNRTMVFMDMYHPGFIETNPVPGFTIAD